MNELQLSNDLNVITAEIKAYQRVAGESIFEIGKRIKHVKENDLVHGEWEKWCEETINISSQQARKYIKVYEEFLNQNLSFGLGINALYLIATLPEEEREKKHTLKNGETKTIDEMTVKELREARVP